jgi:hypothetical protein
MVIIINQGIDIENILVNKLQDYFATLRFSELYPIVNQVHIGLEHPFASLLDQNRHRDMRTLFPSITVVSFSDEKVPELSELHAFQHCEITANDMVDLGASKYQISTGAIAWLNDYFKENEKLYGISGATHRRDHVSLEVWAENIQLKNEIYSMLELFLAGPLKVQMEKDFNLEIFDDTVRGQRSGNYNFDFGQALYGGQISFEADYIVQQTILDSEIIELNQSVWAEVLSGE